MTATIDQLLADAQRRLGEASFAPPRREAALLLGRMLGLSEAQVLARGPEPVPAGAAARFEALLVRRLAAEPVAYLLGEREFFGRPFFVDSRVLIPRPETEHLVEAALALAPSLPTRPLLLDLGTGSGCLAITLALELPASRVVATELSLGALAVAAANARRHGSTGRLALAAADLASPLRLERFDLVVSNPPYVGREEAPRLSPEVLDFEPGAALFAGPGGLAVIERLLAQGESLKPGAFLAFEIGEGQAEAVAARLESRPFQLLELRSDLAGKPRVVVLRRA